MIFFKQEYNMQYLLNTYVSFSSTLPAKTEK